METVLQYRLEQFEGPLDLLLTLISKNKLNIYDIEIAVLVDQYLEQIKVFEDSDIDIASDFLEMASRLIYLKTVSLLPKHEEAEQLKDELVGELLEYKVCKEMAAKFATMTEGFDSFVRTPAEAPVDKTYILNHESKILFDYYMAAVGRGMRRLPPSTEPFKKIVARKIVSVSSKVVSVMKRLFRGGPQRLSSLYKSVKSRSELVATFLAVLELCKANRVTVSTDTEDAKIELNR
jgi:segregation and condensation protein A